MNNALDLKTLADEEVGDAHLMTSVETPMRNDAFDLNDEEKKQKIATHFTEIMNIPLLNRLLENSVTREP